MHKAFWWLIVLFGIGVFAAILYNALKSPPAPVQRPAPATAPAPQAAAPAEPRIRYPVEPPTPEKPLPALDVSDATMKAELDGLLGDPALAGLFLLKDLVRRIVATVDNLPREKAAPRLMPVKPVGGAFLVTGKDASLAVSADNTKRYALYRKLVDAVDTGRLVALYLRFYPLFQQAYRELGYPKGYFNDRLVEVIDHLLGAPEVPATAKLVRPKVFYLYADPAFESQSAGRKLLMRIGNENAAAVKAKLRELRGGIAREVPKP